MEVTGKIADIIYTNSENGYTVALFETEDQFFTAVGTLPECRIGTSFKLTGDFRVHQKYGEQFHFSEFSHMLPTDEESIKDFLASGIIEGVGEKTAEDIVDVFGKESLKVITETPEKLMKVPGIGEKKMNTIAEAFAEQREFAETAMALQKLGIGSADAFRIYRLYGNEAADYIKENPYRLINDFRGFGFKRADDIAEAAGIDRNSPYRIKGAVSYILETSVWQGNTFLPFGKLKDIMTSEMDISSEEIATVLSEMAFEGTIMPDSIDGVEAVYLTEYYEAERHVTSSIASLCDGSLKPVTVDPDYIIRMVEDESGIAFSEEQKEGVRSITGEGVSVITGGPGTGKTTIINAVIKIFGACGFKTEICAPTGRAAKRITETGGYPASTVHRLLEYYYSEEDEEMIFGKDEDDPLDCDVVIVDEASMIDIILMDALVSSLKRGTRLVLVGDYNQLPPVGAGNVLRDIIKSEYVQTVELTEIFRQAGESLIVVNAHRINRGEYPSVNEKDGDFFFLDCHNEKDMASLVVELAASRLPTYYEWLDTKKDIQILTPVKRGTLGTENLNSCLQEALNPPSAEKNELKRGQKLFREGDKVMQIKNNYQLEWTGVGMGPDGNEKEGQGIFNGDCGIITSINYGAEMVTVFFDDDKYVNYDFAGLDELVLAYAITVHKSQGNEFPAVIMPVSWFPPGLATRNLLYTAVTRGKRLVVIAGSREKMNAMIDNNRISMRHSGLMERLKGLINCDLSSEDI